MRAVDPRLIRRARATRSYLVAGLAVGIITAILAIAQAWLLAKIVVDIFYTHKIADLKLVAALATIFAIRAALVWINQIIAHRSAAAVKSQLRKDCLQAALRNPLNRRSSAETVRLTTSGLDALDSYFSSYLPQLLLAVTVPVLILGVVCYVDWISATTMLFTLPLIPIFMMLIGWRTQARVNKRWQVANRLARHFSDLISGLPTLQVFGRAQSQIKGLTDTEDRNRRETLGTLKVSFLSAMVLEFMATISVAVIAVGIGLRLVVGQMDFMPGLFVLIMAPEAYLPIRMVGVRYHDSANGLAAAQAAFDLIDSAHISTGTKPTYAGETVELKNVGHRYPKTEQLALQNLSLTLEPGKVVALSGPTGAGKSTALAAVMGFLKPSQGTIEVSGTPLEDIDSNLWRKRIAWVGQHPGMIAGTVAQNVRLGDANADEAQILDALRLAGAASIPLTQQVGADGVGLSAGERRRVALARALLRLNAGADILVMDEPTAGLDADAEAQVLATVLANSRNRGVSALVVTHRQAVLAVADEVVQVEEVSCAQVV